MLSDKRMSKQDVSEAEDNMTRLIIELSNKNSQRENIMPLIGIKEDIEIIEYNKDDIEIREYSEDKVLLDVYFSDRISMLEGFGLDLTSMHPKYLIVTDVSRTSNLTMALERICPIWPFC
jgi:hypothetical protein